MSTLGKCIYNKYTVFLENCNNRLYTTGYTLSSLGNVQRGYVEGLP